MGGDKNRNQRKWTGKKKKKQHMEDYDMGDLRDFC